MKNEKNNRNKKDLFHGNDSVSSDPVEVQPDNSYELINKYGTYNIQPTANSGNEYPAISPGLAPEKKKHIERERKQWKKTDDSPVQ